MGCYKLWRIFHNYKVYCNSLRFKQMSKKMICFSIPTYVISVLFIFCSSVTPSFGEFPLFLAGKLRELEVKLETNANSQEKINILLVNKVGELEKKVKQLETNLEQYAGL